MGSEILLYAECHHIILALLSLFIGIKLYTFTLFSTKFNFKISSLKTTARYAMKEKLHPVTDVCFSPLTASGTHNIPPLTSSGTHS